MINIFELDKLQIITQLNNLNDIIHIYKNLFVYLDNLDTLNTYDLINNVFLLKILKSIMLIHQFYLTILSSQKIIRILNFII